jgi:hypothetical protein
MENPCFVKAGGKRPPRLFPDKTGKNNVPGGFSAAEIPNQTITSKVKYQAPVRPGIFGT